MLDDMEEESVRNIWLINMYIFKHFIANVKEELLNTPIISAAMGHVISVGVDNYLLLYLIHILFALMYTLACPGSLPVSCPNFLILCAV